jgi:Flp pilus assembly protein TadD
VNVNEAMQLARYYFGENDLQKAANIYLEILGIQPNNYEALFPLGIIWLKLQNYDGAIECFKKALQINPSIYEAYVHLGNIFYERGQLQEAAINYQKALKLNPNCTGTSYNLGLVFQEMQNYDEAMFFYNKALGCDSQYTLAQYNIALLNLLLGNFETGLREYECRRKLSYHFQRFNHIPAWNGGDMKGLTILLYAEQGFGDTIQFIRYAPLVAKRGATVVVEAQKELVPLIKTVPGVRQVIERGDHLPAFNMQCPLLSLPFYFETTSDKIPVSIPYFTIDSHHKEKWRDRFTPMDSKLRIGLVWSGGVKHKKNSRRSLLLEQLLRLSKLEGLIFYSLQKGHASDQVTHLLQGMQLIDYTEDIHDFTDTAAFIEHLDLIISVDTAVAHLAGALGKPVWTLLPYAPDWRWLLNREDSPWYPTMKLFRQPSPGDWESVIGNVQEKLFNLLNSTGSNPHYS